MEYICFTEYNSWEGEHWNFYIPLEGNEKQIEIFKKQISGFENYEVSDKVYSEEEVDVLVENTDSGYMNFHNKLEGKLKETKTQDITGDLYKGGIKKFMGSR